MPLVVIIGQPCTGKTKFASTLMSYLESKNHKVLMFNDESLNIDKSSTYNTPTVEKIARGKLKAAIERSLRKDITIIADNLNYIKGYRYELYCLVRSVGSTHCCVFINSSKEDALRNHEYRKANNLSSYTDASFHELWSRMEVPDPKHRWDAPLVHVVDSEQKSDSNSSNTESISTSTPKSIKSSVFKKRIQSSAPTPIPETTVNVTVEKEIPLELQAGTQSDFIDPVFDETTIPEFDEFELHNLDDITEASELAAAASSLSLTSPSQAQGENSSKQFKYDATPVKPSEAVQVIETLLFQRANYRPTLAIMPAFEPVSTNVTGLIDKAVVTIVHDLMKSMQTSPTLPHVCSIENSSEEIVCYRRVTISELKQLKSEFIQIAIKDGALASTLLGSGATQLPVRSRFVQFLNKALSG
jgi:tRNA uridine 5-carbamoylmethylation protein Kti12